MILMKVIFVIAIICIVVFATTGVSWGVLYMLNEMMEIEMVKDFIRSREIKKYEKKQKRIEKKEINET